MNTVSNSMIKKMSPLLLVADLDRSLEFYTKKLDFDIAFRYEDFYAGIIKEGYSIHLKISDHSIKKLDSNKEDLNIIFSVTHIEELFEELSSKSIDVIQPLRGMTYGKEFYIKDPDNNIIAFVEEV